MGHNDTEALSLTNNKESTGQVIEKYEMLLSSTEKLGFSLHASDPWDLKHGTAFCNIGNTCSRMGLLSEAIAMYGRDLQITTRSLDANDPRVIGSKYNSGLVLCRLGRYAEALTLLEGVLDARISTFDSQHLELANTLTCIGGIYSCTGRHAEALDRYQQAASIRKAALGPDHTTVAQSLRHSATALACLGQTSLAIEDCDAAHAILQRQMGQSGYNHQLAAEVKQLLADLTTGNPRAQVLESPTHISRRGFCFDAWQDIRCTLCCCVCAKPSRALPDLPNQSGHRRCRSHGDGPPSPPGRREPAAQPR